MKKGSEEPFSLSTNYISAMRVYYYFFAPVFTKLYIFSAVSNTLSKPGNVGISTVETS